MKKFYLFSVLVCSITHQNLHAQEQISQDSTYLKNTEILEEIIVSSIRANSKTPIAYSDLSKKEIEKRNLGQDIPILMNFMPSVVTTTDAGNGMGYTGIRVRGSDATRINVTLNGIAYNDSESHGTFWVNMPDFASSLQNLQLQRGVGTSTNGSGAFGASLNLLTDGFSYNPYAEISNSVGSFNSRKHTLKFSSGLLGNQFELQGRISKLKSDGYIDRGWANMDSYFLQGTFLHESTLIKAITFGGNQKTYQAWNGLEQSDIDTHGRRFNTAGMYYDNNGMMQFYDNETDNYKQDHYQLHWNEKWSTNWSTNLALHYTKGFGYFENYKQKQDLKDYGFTQIGTSDLIRRKYLDNSFYGTTFSAQYNHKNFDLILGGAMNEYKGDHFGEILWIKELASQAYKNRYYSDTSKKTDLNGYAKASLSLDNWVLFGDLQLRNVQYKANGLETGLVNDTFLFFNPKAGVTYNFTETNQTYFSYGKAHREPNRNDYENGNPRPEKLDNFELGWRFSNKNQQRLNVNIYYMHYKDQLVLTGALNDVGAPLRENSGNSYRAGIEIDAYLPITSQWIVSPNITLSQNKNLDFKAEIDGEIQNLGNTPIAFSPNIISALGVHYLPTKDFQITWLAKYIGEQYMGNTNSDFSKLDSYFTNDVVFNYSIQPKKYFKQIDIHLMLNNIFNVKYISNGYYYTFNDNWTNPNSIKTVEGAGYYPQAQFNFLTGISLKF